MIYKSIKIKTFRNIKEASIEFSDGVNVIKGLNAQGKTNLLEAINLISTGRPFRRATDADLIMHGEQQAEVELAYKTRSFSSSVRYVIDRTKGKTLYKRKQEQKKISHVFGYFRTVLFCPAHLSIVQDGPAVRRAWIDMFLSQTYFFYLKQLQSYNKLLQQRNALLKEMRSSLQPQDFYRSFSLSERFPESTVALLETFSLQLADASAKISDLRYKHLCRIAPILDSFYERITADYPLKEKIELRYVSNAYANGIETFDPDAYRAVMETPDEVMTSPREMAIREKYLSLFKTYAIREIRSGTSGFGCHRDEIEIYLNGTEARTFASQGQQRTIALAMKLAEGQLAYEMTDDHPVFLLDDILSELDEKRKAFVLGELKGCQVIITSCETIDRQVIDASPSVRVIRAENGAFTVEK